MTSALQLEGRRWVALKPDVLFATSGATVGALQRATGTVPIVFVIVIDPIGGGWVASLARPGGNATGFAASEFSLSAKLLKEIAAFFAAAHESLVGTMQKVLASQQLRQLSLMSCQGRLPIMGEWKKRSLYVGTDKLTDYT